MENSNSFSFHKVQPILQFIYILISLSILGILVNKRLHEFRISEKKPDIIHITPDVYKNFGGFSNVVTVGLFIDRFITFDVVNHNFVFTGSVWFRFTPGAISLDTLGKFTFEQAEILYISPPDTQLIDEQLLVLYNIKVKFSSLLDYESFPFDDHQIYINMLHPFLSPEEIIFSSSEREFMITSDVSTFGWARVNRAVDTGYTKAVIDPFDKNTNRDYPTALFYIDYERYGSRFMLTIFLPLLFIFYLALFSFSLDESSAIRITSGSVTAILAYRFVIDRLSPEVGYFMISDLIFFLALGLCCVTLAINIIDSYSGLITKHIKNITLILLHAANLILTSYFIFG